MWYIVWICGVFLAVKFVISRMKKYEMAQK